MSGNGFPNLVGLSENVINQLKKPELAKKYTKNKLASHSRVTL